MDFVRVQLSCNVHDSPGGWPPDVFGSQPGHLLRANLEVFEFTKALASCREPKVGPKRPFEPSALATGIGSIVSDAFNEQL